jgi:kinesin family protein C2/C3
MTRKLKEKEHSDQAIIAQLKDLEEAFTALSKTHKDVLDQLAAAKALIKKQAAEIETLKRSHVEELRSYKEEMGALTEFYKGEITRLKESLTVSEERSTKLVSDQGFKELQTRRAAGEVTAWKLAMLDVLLRDVDQRPVVESRLRSLLGIKPEAAVELETDSQAHILGVTARIAEILGSQRQEVRADQALGQTQALLQEMTAKYRKEMAERRRLHNQLQDLRGNIRVMCRVRPRLCSELAQEECILASDLCQVKVFNSQSLKESNFEFDRVFLPTDTQEVVYYEVSDLVTSVLDGFHVCILAYGQTGSGKTFTMEGDHSNLGINFRALKELFDIIEARGDCQYALSISMLEVYNEQIRNLLDGTTRLDIREDTNGSPQLPGLELLPISSYKEVLKVMRQGSSNRSVGATLMNEASSRSHCVVTIYVSGRLPDRKVCSKLNLIDLAGSERIWKSEAEGQRMVEACNINQSLSALGKVLYNLAAKQPHIPYRDSKLTHLLKDSLAGDAKTLMIVTVSPAVVDFAESTSSLQFGCRVSCVEKGRARPRGKENIKKKPKRS